MKEICEEAMDQVTTTGVIKLEGAKNWNVWKFQVGVILRSLDLLDIVEGKIVKPEAGQEKGTWLTKDAKAQSLIVTRLSEEVMLHILTYSHSATAIFPIQVHRGHGDVSFSVKSARVTKQTETVRRREEISDRLIITKILMSLPEKYSYFVSAWESTSDDKQTVENLSARLLIEEERLKVKSDSVGESVALQARKQDRVEVARKEVEQECATEQNTLTGEDILNCNEEESEDNKRQDERNRDKDLRETEETGRGLTTMKQD
ncbi:hypothetical protein QE152_g38533 [Popillia japonica]|uniref:Uncharacterized protein n=1 Tax=Popillia japonica TaxID=7064 RepID=A0AAW1HX92_POPJA